MDDPFRRPALMRPVFPRPSAVLDFLKRAFGFERSMVCPGEDGRRWHRGLRFGDGRVCVGSPWRHEIAGPSIGGRNTHSAAHFARAGAAAAVISQQPADQLYGGRRSRARDPDVWTFDRAVRAVSRQDADLASGLKIEGWH